MIPRDKNRMMGNPVHPGQILLNDFLQPMAVTQTQLAAHLGIPLQRVSEIVHGKRGISAETAWMLSGAFGTTPQFWSNLQTNYDLALRRPERPVERLSQAG
jgi:addiction module HigA family antidote